MYEYNLRGELGEDAAGVAELRGKLVWVDPGRKSLGFSEHHPVDNLGRDGYRSQANRRVEVLFFDEGEEPDMDLAASAPEQSELYLPGKYKREHLGAMATGRRRRVQIRILDANRSPRSGVAWVADLNGELRQGTTAADGMVVLNAPPNVTQVNLSYDDMTLELQVEETAPVESAEGLRIRLHNLGYYPGAQNDPWAPATADALRRFQRDEGLPDPDTTDASEVDAVTRSALVARHGH